MSRSVAVRTCMAGVLESDTGVDQPASHLCNETVIHEVFARAQQVGREWAESDRLSAAARCVGGDCFDLVTTTRG